MRSLFLIITAIGVLSLISCDPDVPGEGIDLPPMEFGFKVSPDTAYIKVGDTVTIYTAISNKLENGTVINDGLATISSAISYSSEIPVESASFKQAYEGEYIYVCFVGRL